MGSPLCQAASLEEEPNLTLFIDYLFDWPSFHLVGAVFGPVLEHEASHLDFLVWPIAQSSGWGFPSTSHHLPFGLPACPGLRGPAGVGVLCGVVQETRSMSSDSGVAENHCSVADSWLRPSLLAASPCPPDSHVRSVEAGDMNGGLAAAQSCSSGTWTWTHIFLRPEGKGGHPGFHQNQEEEEAEGWLRGNFDHHSPVPDCRVNSPWAGQ